MHGIIAKLKADLLAFWNVPLVSRAIHTFWQAALSYVIVMALAPHASIDARLALMGAVGAGLSAVKTMGVSYLQGLKKA